MVTDASKVILRSKIVLLKESIDNQNRLLSAVNTAISELEAQKQSYLSIKQQAQNDLRDLKSDIGDV